MLDISREQIEAVRNDPILGPETQSRLADPSLAHKPAADLSDVEWDDLQDACLDALMNESPVAESFDAEQSKGVYSVSICGVPGAYYVTAPEFDDEGVFSCLEDARAKADDWHGEFRVVDDEDGEQWDEEEEWVEPDPREPAFPGSLIPLLAGTDEEDAKAAVRSKILADGDLIMLANGTGADGCPTEAPEVEAFVSAFERSLPKPQGAIDGMARMMKKIPRLRRRSELFLRINGRLPSHREAQKLYDTE